MASAALTARWLMVLPSGSAGPALSWWYRPCQTRQDWFRCLLWPDTIPPPTCRQCSCAKKVHAVSSAGDKVGGFGRENGFIASPFPSVSLPPAMGLLGPGPVPAGTGEKGRRWLQKQKLGIKMQQGCPFHSFPQPPCHSFLPLPNPVPHSTPPSISCTG